MLGIDTSPRPQTARRYHRALPQGTGLEIQLRKNDLPKVLRPSATASDQLSQEEVRPLEPVATQEEDQIDDSQGMLEVVVEAEAIAEADVMFLIVGKQS